MATQKLVCYCVPLPHMLRGVAYTAATPGSSTITNNLMVQWAVAGRGNNWACQGRNKMGSKGRKRVDPAAVLGGGSNPSVLCFCAFLRLVLAL